MTPGVLFGLSLLLLLGVWVVEFRTLLRRQRVVATPVRRACKWCHGVTPRADGRRCFVCDPYGPGRSDFS